MPSKPLSESDSAATQSSQAKAAGGASVPRSWPVQPGLKLIPQSRLDTRSDKEIVSALLQHHPVTSEKYVWAYWHSGLLQAPPWVQRTVINWARRLPSWTIRVLDKVPNSSLNVYNFFSPAFLPDAFNNNAVTGPHTGPHSADLVRLPLVYLHGGFWMDVGTLLFRDLDDICWHALEDPQNPYELAGFTLNIIGDRKTLFNSFVAARKGNEFIKRWMDIYLKVWKGVTEQTSMHSHPLLKHLPLPGSTKKLGIRAGKPSAENLDPQPSSQEANAKRPELSATRSEPDEQELLFSKTLADYGLRFYCFTRLSHLEDPSDGFKCLLAQQLTGRDGNKQFEYLSARRSNANKGSLQDDLYLNAEMFAEALVKDSCQMKVSHGIKGNAVFLGNLWEKPGNEDADHAEGTFAAYLRYASVFLEQTREMKREPWGQVEKDALHAGVTEVGET
ncbi:hypothetical protein EPUS_05024 [Endocarpon pusillum Z07020]|uniref:Capsule polysaccharide biosynthesis protein n=1 Tax=Endocarpon pusillum (strain Z07020 / HMAS-L-300199) TaxID=1263415 RepID=U1GL48_ENDPU|nr:uncharacterized protein EPUS_05024 [Endocarpon pusillum Z07020]ERF72943.1 hypothetical protein EPUS_05024 [Endocarpon pusillum Z07020]